MCNWPGARGRMRAADHQFQQPLVVGLMEKQGTPGVTFDVEGPGYGFRVVKDIPATQNPAAKDSCQMRCFSKGCVVFTRYIAKINIVRCKMKT